MHVINFAARLQPKDESTTINTVHIICTPYIHNRRRRRRRRRQAATKQAPIHFCPPTGPLRPPISHQPQLHHTRPSLASLISTFFQASSGVLVISFCLLNAPNSTGTARVQYNIRSSVRISCACRPHNIVYSESLSTQQKSKSRLGQN